MDVRLSQANLIVSRLARAGESLRLSPEELAHARARRLRRGDPVALWDGSGACALGVLTRLDRSIGQVTVEAVEPAIETGPALSLYVAGVRAGRLSWIAEKATEFGASQLTLVRSQRTQAFRAAAGLVARLERVVREAAKQCESPRWPRIVGPISLGQVLRKPDGSHRLVLDSEGGPFPSRLSIGPAALLVGPEGGWSESERQAAQKSGWSLVTLPAGKLRTETAAVAALALTLAALARTVSGEP